MRAVRRVRARDVLRLASYALAASLPFALLVRADRAWNPRPRLFTDDVFLARMCLPAGVGVWWRDYGAYRILSIPFESLLERVASHGAARVPLLAESALALSAAVFVCACVAAGLGRRRAVLLLAALAGSPLLLPTLRFWAGALNFSLLLLLLAAQLGATLWARRRGGARASYAVVAAGALLSLLTYEVALPFVVSTALLDARGRLAGARAAAASASLACAFVLALAASGLYYPNRLRALLQRPTEVERQQSEPATEAGEPQPRAQPPRASRRLAVYAVLLPSLARTGLASAPVWLLLCALAVLIALPRRGRDCDAPRREEDDEPRATLPAAKVSLCFALSLCACLLYFAASRRLDARYTAFLFVYGACALAWARAPLCFYALAIMVAAQSTLAAGLVAHLRAADALAEGRAAQSPTGVGDLVTVEGRVVRLSWLARDAGADGADLQDVPLGAKRCRYVTPCGGACR